MLIKFVTIKQVFYIRFLISNRIYLKTITEY